MYGCFKPSNVVAVGVVALVLGACESLFQTPYSLQIAEFDERPPQQAAAIAISDPQIYQRETLVNDRLREARLIKRLLDDSEKPEFTDRFQPQLARDLVSYQAFAAEGRLAADPSKGLAAQRTERLNDLKQEIEETKLRTDLEKARRDLRLVQDENTPSEELPETSSNLEQQEPTVPELPDIQRIQQRLEKAATRAKDLLGELEKRAGEGNVRATDIKATPQEQYRDLSAYRAELRQALAAINLDDLHDLDGNALYRFQFR
jgi:hypothetical protein